MKCHFCNWDNPEGRTNCEKCNHPLQTGLQNPILGIHEKKTVRQPASAANTYLKATVREGSLGNMAKTVMEDKEECPECGYKMENGVCPSCGFVNPKEVNVALKQMNMNADGKKTVRPLRKGEKDGRFVLTPISEENGQPEGEILLFDGNEVTLNRDNTDPKNSTITSQQQAVITHEEGKWRIMDQSEYRTTFVQACRKIELQSGDLILLGNQLYRFDILSE